MTSFRTICLCALVCSGSCGCGGASDGLADLVPVFGTVTIDGEPLSHGTVGFVPAGANGQPASGEIKDGKFTMTTTMSSQGVVAGNYKVLIVSLEESTFELPEGTAPDPHNPPPAPPSLIPGKYADATKSGLEVDVQPRMSSIAFDLESTAPAE